MGTEHRFPSAEASHADQNRRQVASNTAKGTSVYAPDGNRIGQIDHVMVDEASGEIVCAIVDFGAKKSFGFEIDQHRVPWSLLTYNSRFEGYELRIVEQMPRRV
jgi:sporulation protein YlmC with PRC-barrel domain